MRVLLFSPLALALLVCTPPPKPSLPPTPVTPTVLEIHPAVKGTLDVLADGMRQEIVACLYGEVRGDTAVINRVILPQIMESTPTTVSFVRCDGNVLAMWHNHPNTNIRRSPLDACTMSTPDMLSSLRMRVPFTLIQVDRQTLCWWKLHQVQDYAVEGHMHIPPLQDQIMFSHLRRFQRYSDFDERILLDRP